MRKTVFAILAIIFTVPAIANADTNLFILWGQSNMARPLKGSIGALNTIPANVIYCKDDESNVPFDCPPSFSKQKKVGPEIGLAPAISAQFPDDLNIILKVSRAGTAMDKWTAGGELYDLLLERINDVVEMYGPVKYRGVFGCQGESDAMFEPLSQLYAARMEAMITGLRETLCEPGLPFFVTVTNPPASFAYRINVNFDQLSFPSKIANVHLVTTVGLAKIPGKIHYTPSAERTLGLYMGLVLKESVTD